MLCACATDPNGADGGARAVLWSRPCPCDELGGLDMTNSPLFTTVIPVHNRPDMVRQALSSVLSQQDVDQQVIVVDDGSTDDTPGVLLEYSDRITVLRQANREPGEPGGPGAA